MICRKDGTDFMQLPSGFVLEKLSLGMVEEGKGFSSRDMVSVLMRCCSDH
jgi:hypothetical protein